MSKQPSITPAGPEAARDAGCRSLKRLSKWWYFEQTFVASVTCMDPEDFAARDD